MVEQSWEERQQGEAFQVVLFLLPPDPSNHDAIQDRFFLDGDFWKPFLARMLLWTQPFALSKTETPEGEPALALFVNFTDFDDVLFQVGQDIAEALSLPAFAVTLTFLDRAAQEDLLETPPPW